MIPDEIKRFVELFSKLPSIGPRAATRLAFKLVSNGSVSIQMLARALFDLSKLKLCSECFFVFSPSPSSTTSFAKASTVKNASTDAEALVDKTEDTLCSICADTKRHTGTYMVVEKETDLMSIEKTGMYDGAYLVLGELTRSGVLEDEQKRRLDVLKKTIREKSSGRADSTGSTSSPQASSPQAEEIILALNPTTYGDLTATLIQKELAPVAKKITRIGRGLPTGGEIEFADEDTLTHSLQRRE